MKGICFVEPLFHKVVKGEKTQTRRIIMIQPLDDRAWRVGTLMSSTAKEDNKKIGRNHYLLLENEYSIKESDNRHFLPKYKLGEIVYLKEPYVITGKYIIYKFGSTIGQECDKAGVKWSNKLFMPESAARYFIKITAVRAERLQDITIVDCRKEGVEICKECIPGGCLMGESCAYPRLEYSGIIDRINGKGTWKSNPFVWVYDFEQINKENI